MFDLERKMKIFIFGLAIFQISASLEIIWNLPSHLCRSKNFDDLLENFNITHNAFGKFEGDKIAILYDPGAFPWFETVNGIVRVHNGGLPQSGNIDYHLAEFERSIDKKIPKNFSGLGVLDFEKWRVDFVTNWKDLLVYRTESKNKVEKEHPEWHSDQHWAEAASQFNEKAQLFFIRTISKAQEMRPKARWGYYGYPQCYNFQGKYPKAQCQYFAIEGNDRLLNLFNKTDILLPSTYISSSYNETTKMKYLKRRLKEAKRVSKNSKNQEIYSYIQLRYRNSSAFLNETDLKNSIRYHIEVGGIKGAILWGSSHDLKTRKDCDDLYEYVNDTAGPVIQNLQREKIKTNRIQ